MESFRTGNRQEVGCPIGLVPEPPTYPIVYCTSDRRVQETVRRSTRLDFQFDWKDVGQGRGCPSLAAPYHRLVPKNSRAGVRSEHHALNPPRDFIPVDGYCITSSLTRAESLHTASSEFEPLSSFDFPRSTFLIVASGTLWRYPFRPRYFRHPAESSSLDAICNVTR